MSANCCSTACHSQPAVSPRFRRALWIALAINAAMFAVEIAAGWRSGSVSLLADAVDFAGDAVNYGISLAVLAMTPVWRSNAAKLKGMTMVAFGFFVLGKTAWSLLYGATPEPFVMGTVAILALVANAISALLLYAFREGDANMRSVWLCSRNDAIGNVAVMLAAAGVFGTGSALPDLIVALVMACMALSSGMAVVRHANEELLGIATGHRSCG